MTSDPYRISNSRPCASGTPLNGAAVISLVAWSESGKATLEGMPPAQENELATFNSRAGKGSSGSTPGHCHYRSTRIRSGNDGKHQGCNEVTAQGEEYASPQAGRAITSDVPYSHSEVGLPPDSRRQLSGHTSEWLGFLIGLAAPTGQYPIGLVKRLAQR